MLNHSDALPERRCMYWLIFINALVSLSERVHFLVNLLPCKGLCPELYRFVSLACFSPFFYTVTWMRIEDEACGRQTITSFLNRNKNPKAPLILLLLFFSIEMFFLNYTLFQNLSTSSTSVPLGVTIPKERLKRLTISKEDNCKLINTCQIALNV